jgi:hypothetical protein
MFSKIGFLKLCGGRSQDHRNVMTLEPRPHPPALKAAIASKTLWHVRFFARFAISGSAAGFPQRRQARPTRRWAEGQFPAACEMYDSISRGHPTASSSPAHRFSASALQGSRGEASGPA